MCHACSFPFDIFIYIYIFWLSDTQLILKAQYIYVSNALIVCRNMLKLDS